MTTAYYTFDLGDRLAGFLRRIRTDEIATIEVVSGGQWVDMPDALRYFEGFGGDQLDVVELTEGEAHQKAAALGVALEGDVREFEPSET